MFNIRFLLRLVGVEKWPKWVGDKKKRRDDLYWGGETPHGKL